MAGITVIALNGHSVLFPDNISFFRKNFGESIPIISIKHAVIEVGSLAVKAGESLCVPFAEYPNNRAICLTTHDFDKPELVVLVLNEMPHFIELNPFYYIGYFSFRKSFFRLTYLIIDYRRPGFEDFRQHVKRCFA